MCWQQRRRISVAEFSYLPVNATDVVGDSTPTVIDNPLRPLRR